MAGKTRSKSIRLSIKNTRIKLLIFTAKLLVLSLPVLLIVGWEWYGLQRLTASIINWLLNLIRVESVLFDTLSSSLTISPALYMKPGLVIVIDFACTGFRSLYLLFALLFSLEWNWKKQLKYLFLGAGVLFLVNIFRIFMVTLLVLYFNLPVLFESLLWTGMLNLAVFIIILDYLIRK